MAWPPLTFDVPKGAPSAKNFTVPEGSPLYCGAMVAVKVTLCPVTTGVTDVVRLVVVEAGLTTWLTAVEVEDWWFDEPP